jgi:hypothetical protein
MAGLTRAFTTPSERHILSGLWWFRFLLLLVTATPSLAASVTARLDRDTVLLGDTATLSFTFDGTQSADVPVLPDIPGLQTGYTGQSSAVNFVNGQMSATLTHNFILRPTQVGEFIIPSISVRAGGKTFTTQALKLRVVRGQAPEPGSAAEEQQPALLRLVLPKTNVYVGETILLELHLLIRSGIQPAGNFDVPLVINGASVGKLEQGQPRRTLVGSTEFTLYPLSAPLTILKSGPLAVGPLDGSIVVTVPTRRRDPFDLFGMFNTGMQQRVILAAPGQTLNALPLPETGRPASFSGAVGDFRLAFSAGPTNVAVGDPVTVRVQISGRGLLEPVALPEQPAWREFKTYPPTSRVETSGPFGLEGVKTFEQVIVPQNTEVREVPAFEFSYFDPEQGRYVTLREPPIPLTVRPSAGGALPTIAMPATGSVETPPPRDIVHIKTRLGRPGAGEPWLRQPWFLALQGVPVVAFFAALGWRRRADALERNPRLRRQRATQEFLRRSLGELRHYAEAGEAERFFTLLTRILQEAIGERLDLPASGITEAVIDEKLRPQGLAPASADALHELFQLCNQARYAPAGSPRELKELLPRLDNALQGLRDMQA